MKKIANSSISSARIWIYLFGWCLFFWWLFFRTFISVASPEFLLNRLWTSFVYKYFSEADHYLLWTAFLNKKKWHEARNEYEKITNPTELTRLSLHNIGSSYFYEGTSSGVIQKTLLKKASLAYESSLSIHDDLETREDLQVVRSLLDEIEKKEEIMKQAENTSSKKDKNSQSTSDQNTENSSQSSWSGKTEKSWSSSKDNPSTSNKESLPTKTSLSGNSKFSTENRITQTENIEKKESLSPSEKEYLGKRQSEIENLQKQKSEFTRLNGTENVSGDTPADVFEKLFSNDSIFGSPNLHDPEDY